MNPSMWAFGTEISNPSYPVYLHLETMIGCSSLYLVTLSMKSMLVNGELDMVLAIEGWTVESCNRKKRPDEFFENPSDGLAVVQDGLYVANGMLSVCGILILFVKACYAITTSSLSCKGHWSKLGTAVLPKSIVLLVCLFAPAPSPATSLLWLLPQSSSMWSWSSTIALIS